MKIAVIGTGYVGLVTGCCLAEIGHTVACMDISEEKISMLCKGNIPIYEPGLQEMVSHNMKQDRLLFTCDLSLAVNGASIVFIAVGTPSGEDGSADLQYVIRVAEELGKVLLAYTLVVVKSTVPVGTSQLVRNAIKKELAMRKVSFEFDMASNPEFLKEGNAIRDFMEPERVIAGVDSYRAKELLSLLYQPFVLNGHPVYFMDIPSSELTKYAANAMLATRISFMNDIANLCERVGADVKSVKQGIGSDARIGNRFLYAGVGYGGSCFPKDVKALCKTGKDLGYPLRILEAVEAINEDQKLRLFHKVKKYFGEDLQGMVFAILGLAFKPKTDDFREAPSLALIQSLLDCGAVVKVVDPAVSLEAKNRLSKKIVWCDDLYLAATQADAILLVTEWTEFRSPDWLRLKTVMRHCAVFDGRNIYDPDIIKSSGFFYTAIGRPLCEGSASEFDKL